MTIKTFDKANLKSLSAEIEAAVAAIAAKHGLRLAGGIGGRYSDMEFTIKGTLKVTDAATVADAARQDWNRYAGLDGFSPEDFGKTFKFSGSTYTISGYNPRSPKRPIKATGTDGKVYVFGPEVKRLMVA